MKKMFRFHIEKRDKPLFTIEPIDISAGFQTITVNLNQEFKLGEVSYIILKTGFTYKIQILWNNEEFRIYTRLSLLLPITLNELSNKKSIVGIRPPANRLETILANFKIGFKTVKFTNSDIRIVDNYEFKITDGSMETAGASVIFKNFNWIILANKTNNKMIFNKIILRENINMYPESLNELESRISTFRFYDHYSELKSEDIRPAFEKMILESLKINKKSLANVLYYKSEPFALEIKNIDDNSIYTDGLIHDDVERICSDYSYIIKRDLRCDLTEIYINPDKINVGMIYLVQTIISEIGGCNNELRGISK